MQTQRSFKKLHETYKGSEYKIPESIFWVDIREKKKLMFC